MVCGHYLGKQFHTLVLCSSAPRVALTLDVYVIVDCQENKVMSRKWRISKTIRRIPTWEDCREKCNKYAKCHQFNFQVCSAEISIR